MIITLIYINFGIKSKQLVMDPKTFRNEIEIPDGEISTEKLEEILTELQIRNIIS